jgi:hypothetical protein
MCLDDAQRAVQHGADRLRLALQVPAQAFGHGGGPLAHRKRWENVSHQMRRGLRHWPGVARRTHPTFAREGNQEVMAAVRKSGPREAIGEDAAFEVAAELAFHSGRHAPPVPVVFTPSAR